MSDLSTSKTLPPGPSFSTGVKPVRDCICAGKGSRAQQQQDYAGERPGGLVHPSPLLAACPFTPTPFTGVSTEPVFHSRRQPLPSAPVL